MNRSPIVGSCALSRCACILSLIAIVAAAPGCATLVSGSQRSINVNSEPAGAEVLLNGMPVGRTPAVVNLTSNGASNLEVRLPGYQSQYVPMQRVFNNATLGNLCLLPLGLLPGLVGFAVDAATGSMYSLTPDQVNVSLQKAGQTNLQGAGDVAIFIVMEADPEWELIGQLEPVESRSLALAP